MTRYRDNDQADRGKDLENAIREYLKERSNNPEFYFHRFPDARTGRGRIKKQPADFIVWQKGKADTLIDPKEISPTRRDKGDRLNFKNRCSQVPKMARMNMAGVMAYFLVYHTATEKYYVISRTFISSLIDKNHKSLKLSEQPSVDTLKEALDQILGEE